MIPNCQRVRRSRSQTGEIKATGPMIESVVGASDERLYALPPEEAEIEVTFSRVSFKDGTELKPFGSFEEVPPIP